jgi:hypothetical protein
MRKIIVLSLLLAGCATLDTSSLDWIPIGPEFAPTDPAKIQVLSSGDDIKRAYGNIGLLRIKNLKPERDILRMGVERGQKYVASKGADAMLLGQYNSASDGAPDPRVTLIIYAIKYMDMLTAEDKKALEDFEILGILNERTVD